jgi:hypothetical protein
LVEEKNGEEKMKKIISALLFATGLSLSLFAAEYEKDGDLTAIVGVSAIAMDGNSYETELRYFAELEEVMGEHKLKLVGSIATSSLQDYLLQYENNYAGKSFYFGSYKFKKDDRKRLTRRDRVSMGAGTILIQEDHRELKIQTGLSYFHEDFRSIKSDTFLGITFGESYQHDLGLGFQLRQEGEFTQSFENSDHYFYETTLGVRKNIDKNWLVDLSAKLEYESEVPYNRSNINKIVRHNTRDVKKLDSYLYLSLMYSF